MPRSSKLLNVGAGAAPTTTTVTNSSTEILAANSDRKWCLVTNIGGRDVYVAIGQTAILNRGALLKKQGGSFLMDRDFMSFETLNGITASGSSAVIVLEGN